MTTALIILLGLLAVVLDLALYISVPNRRRLVGQWTRYLPGTGLWVWSISDHAIAHKRLDYVRSVLRRVIYYK